MQPADPYFISKGGHTLPADGRCAMEWVAYIAGEEHSSSPACVDMTLRSLVITVNDQMDDDNRQKLRPYLARMIGTRDDGLHAMRDAVIRSCPSLQASTAVSAGFSVGCNCEYCARGRAQVAGWDWLWPLLDALLPLEQIDLPTLTSERALEVCAA